MSEEWVIIFTSSHLYEIELMRGVLFENDIETIVINKQDSLYLFGDIELHVSIDDVFKAKQIISKINEIE